MRGLPRLADAQAERARARRRADRGAGARLETAVSPNLLDRRFEAAGPNREWVADFTTIWTAEGWLYVAVVIDPFSRFVVGWSMRAAMMAELVTDALLQHSDQGSQYTSAAFQRLMAANGVTGSMSRAGNVWDNAGRARASSPRSRPSARRAGRTGPATRPGPKCSTASRASTTPAGVTRRWATSVPRSSK